ncbi:MAG: hypothetical protein GX442_22685 [Candidatus Riflebacteria bacterium]|nr:hypothetical protein [Candidatus Riflebacteria bacterium]
MSTESALRRLGLWHLRDKPDQLSLIIQKRVHGIEMRELEAEQRRLKRVSEMTRRRATTTSNGK